MFSLYHYISLNHLAKNVFKMSRRVLLSGRFFSMQGLQEEMDSNLSFPAAANKPMDARPASGSLYCVSQCIFMLLFTVAFAAIFIPYFSIFIWFLCHQWQILLYGLRSYCPSITAKKAWWNHAIEYMPNFLTKLNGYNQDIVLKQFQAKRNPEYSDSPCSIMMMMHEKWSSQGSLESYWIQPQVLKP